jgi:hypothetical protein
MTVRSCPYLQHHNPLIQRKASNTGPNSPRAAKAFIRHEEVKTCKQLYTEAMSSEGVSSEQYHTTTKKAYGTVLVFIESFELTNDGTSRDMQVYARCQFDKHGEHAGAAAHAAAAGGVALKGRAMRTNADAFDDAELHNPAASASGASGVPVGKVELCMKKAELIEDAGVAGKDVYKCAAGHITTVPEDVVPSPALMAGIKFLDCNEYGFEHLASGPAERDESLQLVVNEASGGFKCAPVISKVTANGGKQEGAVHTRYSATIFDEVCRALLGPGVDAATYLALGQNVDSNDAVAMQALRQRTLEVQDKMLGRVMLAKVTLEVKIKHNVLDPKHNKEIHMLINLPWSKV